MALSFLRPLQLRAEEPETWLGFWRQRGHGHKKACGVGKDGHRVSWGVFKADQNGLILPFFKSGFLALGEGNNHPGWLSSAARLQIRTDSYEWNIALLGCNPVPILHFMAAGCGCKSQQEVTSKPSQVFKGNTPLSPLPEALPASCRSPCPELGAQITLVPPWLFHRPLRAAWAAAYAGRMQPQGQDSRWVPRGVSPSNMATYSVLPGGTFSSAGVSSQSPTVILSPYNNRWRKTHFSITRQKGKFKQNRLEITTSTEDLEILSSFSTSRRVSGAGLLFAKDKLLLAKQ